MDGHAPANPLRRSLPGADRVKPENNLGAAKPSWRKAKRTSGPHRLKSWNRRMRTRMSGGVGGEEPRGSPLSRLLDRASGRGLASMRPRVIARGNGDGHADRDAHNWLQ